jgi:molecular chaperone HtpG
MSAGAEVFQFQAETKQLLNLMINSLYTSKDIFLRELISNASDALDRLRFEALTRHELIEGDDKFEIRLATDREAKTLTVSDNGIGMSREEVIENIGTIAKSGTSELRQKIKEGASNEQLAELIGQFGVGFYSTFMVADRVVLVTRRAGSETAVRWESSGDGNYTISEVEKPERGTGITLHLKPLDPETGMEDYTDKWILTRIVKRYSDFVSYPIVYVDRREGGEVVAEGSASEEEQPEKSVVIEDKVLNTMKPLWLRSTSEVTDEEYNEFYKHIHHDLQEPLTKIHFRAEGRLEYQSLLFIPHTAPPDLYYHASERGLRLYAKSVLIMERCEDLVPRYLRFVRGVVDSADLPLNISRQMLQQDRHITQIQKGITKKVLDELANMASDEQKYLSFWEQFGRAIKEGAASDWENREKIISLLLIASSNDPEKLTTLKDYVSRMKADQTQIFYLTGQSRSVVENSPHLEVFKEKGYEVLFLTDPVDELVVQTLPEYDGHKLKSVGKGTMKLGSEEDHQKVEDELKKQEEQASELLLLLQQKLDEHVKQVRLTNRLTTSPVCLVAGAEHDDSPYIEQLLQRGRGGGSKQRRIMELNPQHEIFTKLKERFQNNADDALLSDYAKLLLGYALLAEGSELPEPAEYNRVVASLMARAL